MGLCVDEEDEDLEETGEGSGYNAEYYQCVGAELCYQCLIGLFMLHCNKAYDLPIRAVLRDKGQSELRGLIKANQRGTQ